ncbi:nodulation protein NfeD [Massilia sp. YIM B02763]|uniref:NfeD family protein n=1 Tax=Massilia sp. YIM B02763 TaxID=3050130 RepID=UPI0025B71EB2|nr:nodulation protein NfeD [Massilia sp. YIM B02763]MDN4053895.1 nodulation protein NfeD [Massilia sp. YIM B02763]
MVPITAFRRRVGAPAPGLPAARALLRLVLAILVLLLPVAADGAPGVGLIRIDGAIGPASADYLVRGLARSAAAGHQLVVVELDTPGGLDTSMRSAIKAILASPVPVAVFVAPSGARAASAGTYLLYASHIAAMAPGTNLGAATPVAIGVEPSGAPGGQAPPRAGERAPAGKDAPANPAGDKAPVPDTDGPMSRKQVNDAAAYLRGLAQLRGRNADWAERAVRESVSLTADEALTLRVIDYVAPDVSALLARVDGSRVAVQGQVRQLRTRAAPLAGYDPDWRTNVLAAITNPSVALLLMTIGIYGLVFEFMNPGVVVPGVVGAISLLLGLYALQLLPVNYAGLGLIVLGLLFMLGEAFLPSFGILGIGGVVAFVAGALILIDTELPGYGAPPILVAVLGLASALLLVGTVQVAMATRRRPVRSGAAALVGSVGHVEQLAGGDGRSAWARVDGELWQVTGNVPLRPSQAVKVTARDGLLLQVVPVNVDKGERR